MVLQLQRALALPGGGGLLLPGLHPQHMALDDVFQGVPVGPGALQGRIVLPGLLFQIAQALLLLGEGPAQGGFPVQQLLGSRRQGGEEGTGLGGRGAVQALLLPQSLQLRRQSARLSGRRPGFFFFRRQFPANGFPVAQNGGQTRPAGRDLGRQGVVPPGLLLQLPPDTPFVFLIVGDAAAQEGDGAL